MFNDRGNPSPSPSATSTDSLLESLQFSKDSSMPASTPSSSRRASSSAKNKKVQDKWSNEEEKLLVQLWAENHDQLEGQESRTALTAWCCVLFTDFVLKRDCSFPHKCFVTGRFQVGFVQTKSEIALLCDLALKGKLSVLEDLDKSILELVEGGNIDKEIEESEGIKDEIHLNLLKLDSLLKELKTPSEPSEHSPVSTSSQATGSTSHSTELPTLVLKKFSGDPKTWQEWWDSFKVAVHENGISDVEKFNHLRSLVEGAAYATIAGLSLTEENYKTAIDLLQERFAQKQIIINSHMDAMLKLNSVSTMADIKKIRQIYDQVEIHVVDCKHKEWIRRRMARCSSLILTCMSTPTQFLSSALHCKIKLSTSPKVLVNTSVGCY